MSKLNKKELAWLARLEKCLAAAPKTLGRKVRAFTIGDDDITVYSIEAVEAIAGDSTGEFDMAIGDLDVCQQVDKAGAEIINLVFPFTVESTAG